MNDAGVNDAGVNSTLNRACKLLEALVAECPERPEYRLALAESYARAEGRLEPMRPEDMKVAEASVAMAAEYARQTVEEHPTVPAYANSLVHIVSRLATIPERHAQEFDGTEHRTLPHFTFGPRDSEIRSLVCCDSRTAWTNLAR